MTESEVRTRPAPIVARFPGFLPESLPIAARTVVGWALRSADHVPAQALRVLYYPGRGTLMASRPRDYLDVFEAARLELVTRTLVANGLARDAAELLARHRGRATRDGWHEDAVRGGWTVEQVREGLGLAADDDAIDGAPALPSTAVTAIRDVQEAATRIRAILVRRTLDAMLEVGAIVRQVRTASSTSYRALAAQTGLGISHTALRNAEKVVEQYDSLPPWVRHALPYSHHVALLPVADEAARLHLALRAFERNIPLPLRQFRAIVAEVAGRLPPAYAPTDEWGLALRGLEGSVASWDKLVESVESLPSERLEAGVEAVGEVLDRLSTVEERLAAELARRRREPSSG